MITHKEITKITSCRPAEGRCCRAKDRQTMKMNKRFIASIIRAAKSGTADLPWAAARQPDRQASKRKLV
jgi:hypothetical protein